MFNELEYDLTAKLNMLLTMEIENVNNIRIKIKIENDILINERR